MSRIRRILFGEPPANKQWTVWYYDNCISSKLLKVLFGTRGCYRVDCDHINFFIPATGFIVMHNSEKDGAEYVWTLQIEKYKMNFGYDDNIKTVQKKYEEMANDGKQAYMDQISNMVPTHDMFG
jgi:hypothetical protein